MSNDLLPNEKFAENDLEELNAESRNERDDGLFESWLRDRRLSLIDDFIEENPTDFKDFCDNFKKDFIVQFENEFYDFCKEVFHEERN